ncbi:S8 family serine peptidase [Streptosporangium subroseum]|uniref:S8 family serine peptidase n=1 Tax=Streptosporangium subroseum TaxID=106412 RepID=UPI00343F56CD
MRLASLVPRLVLPTVLTLITALFVNGAPASAAPPTPPTRPTPASRLEPRLAETLAARGSADVFVILKEKADLSATRSLKKHADRTAYGFQALTATADRSQAGLRALLRASHVDFRPYWLVNTILVRGASPELVDRLGARSDVARVRAAGSVTLPEPEAQTRALAQVAAVEWGVDRVGAPRVWNELHVRGEGVVVATIDSGVQYDHPALAAHYRGYRAGGAYVHDYNWFDPTLVCGVPSATPCDNNGHGTHTMGTIVGDDGAANHTGVAPGATWISAKGCATSSCADADLLAAGQWMLAPTDLMGRNPRPDLAPHIVSNSWGGATNDPFYQQIVSSWAQAGIFPVFAAGNDGPSCGTAHSPGDYDDSYAVGAFGEDGKIASFSSRGAEDATGTKPNITAPGSSVRSSVPGGKYDVLSGTSMATPHVAGAIALLWSAAPGLRGDIATTRRLLDETAVDTEDYSCGGTKENNQVWGEGRLDAFAAALLAPRGVTGTLTGTVADLDGTPLPHPVVTVSASGARRTVTGDALGSFSVAVAPGAYEVSAGAFGFTPATLKATVTAGATSTLAWRLTSLPKYDVVGEVLQSGGEPLPGVAVTIEGTPYPTVTTSADGTFGMAAVPVGTWRVSVKGARCGASTTVTVVVDGDEYVTIETPLRKDDFGNKCDVLPRPTWTAGTTVLPLTGDDAATAVTLPFTFPLYGKAYTKAYVSTNGFLNFQRLNNQSQNGAIPSGGLPNAAVYAFWDDLVVDASASVLSASLGTAPHRRFLIEWRNVSLLAQPAARLTFSVELHENGQIFFQYKTLPVGTVTRGGSATVGLEDGTGLEAFDYSVNQPSLRPGMGIRFYGSGVVQGVVRTVDGKPVSGLEIDLYRPSDATVILTSVTDASGVYRFFAPQGAYKVVSTDSDWEYAMVPVTVTEEGQVITADLTVYPGDSTITGTVRDDSGKPMAGVTVALQDSRTPSATTNAEGAYTLSGVHGGPQFVQVLTRACEVRAQRRVAVGGDLVLDLTAGMPIDSSGFACSRKAKEYVPGTDPADVGEAQSAMLPLPFAFPLSGGTFTTVGVTPTGILLFYDPLNPDWSWAGPFQADLVIDDNSAVLTATVGQGADRRFVVEWRNVELRNTDLRLSFEAVLYPDGRILLQYGDLPDDERVRDGDALVGVSNAYGPEKFLIWGALDPAVAFELSPSPRAS